MRIHRSAAFFLSAALLAMCCGGCGSGGGVHPQTQADAEISLQLLAAYTYYPLAGVGTADGFYYVQSGVTDNFDATLRYIDYASAVDVPLSAQANSDASSVADTAYLESVIGDCQLFFWQDNLYFLQGGATGYVGMEDRAQGHLYRMNPDGSNRQTIYQCGSGKTLLTGAAASGDDLYLLQQGSKAVSVIRVSADGGSTAVTARLAQNAYPVLLGCSGSELYLQIIAADPEQTDANGNPLYTNTLTALDVETGQSRIVMDLTGTLPCIAGDVLCLLYAGDAPRIDLCSLTGEVRQSVSLAGLMGDSIAISDSCWFQAVGQTLAIECWDTARQAGCSILVDADTGEAALSRAVMGRSDEKDVTGALLFAATDEYYLAATNTFTVDTAAQFDDGTAVQQQRYEYTLFSRQQFTADPPQGRVITRMD